MATARLEPTLGGMTFPKSFIGPNNFGRHNGVAGQPPGAKRLVGCSGLLCRSRIELVFMQYSVDFVVGG